MMTKMMIIITTVMLIIVVMVILLVVVISILIFAAVYMNERHFAINHVNDATIQCKQDVKSQCSNLS